MKYFGRLLWRWSWLVSFPVAVIFIYWGGATVERYFTFAVRYNPSPAHISLAQTGDLEFSHLLRRLRLAVYSPQNYKSTLGLREINLFVPESNLARLNANLPHSGFEYVEGGVWAGDKLLKAKIRYRGDFINHWGYFKKSIRAKTRKKALFEGMRAFNLIAPKFKGQLHSFLSYSLAHKMGLVAPRTELVNLTLNGKLVGVHVLVEQLEELTLRTNGLMPADLYAGELLAKDAYEGLNGNLFKHPGLWEKKSINNHYPAESRKPLELLLTLINTGNSEIEQHKLSQILDIEEWGKFSAFETLSRSFHYDNTHNWRIYYDPYRSLFVPVVWDPVGWPVGWLPKNGETAQLDIITSQLHKVLSQNGDFLRARHAAVEKFFSSGLDDVFLRDVDETIEVMKTAIVQDPNITPPDTASVLAEMISFKPTITKVFSDLERGYLGVNGKVLYHQSGNNSTVLQLSISGRRPVKLLTLKYADRINTSVSAKLRYWQQGIPVENDITGALRQGGAKLDISIPLLSNFVPVVEGNNQLMQRRLEVHPAYYEVVLDGISTDNILLEILADRGGSKTEQAEPVGPLNQSSFDNMYVVANPEPIKVSTIWSGFIEIEGEEHIKGDLVIRPGTTISFKPGATLILQGRLTAEGSLENPIMFIPAHEGQAPWGALVLKGQGATGSRLRYCEFSGGSGLKTDLIEYTAMFSVHDVQGVVIENCRFRDSQVTDDMVHTVYSKIRFNNCTFKRSLMDALDIDISNAVVERCHFIDSGNDSIDLMTSNAVVIDTIIEKAGDKAASVGEGSYLLAINNVFRNNMIGVQVKDGSVASLYNVDLIDNNHALDAYKKNWRYNDGGDIFFYKGRIVRNDKVITADKKSKIRVYDSYIDKSVETKKKRIKLDNSVDSQSEQKARTKQLDRYKKEVTLMKEFDSRYWDRVDVERRGALNVARP